MYCCNFYFMCWRGEERATYVSTEALERNYGGRLVQQEEELKF
jgi:hypothetical protein